MGNQELVEYAKQILIRQGFVESKNGWIKEKSQSKIEIEVCKNKILYLRLSLSSEILGGLFISTQKEVDRAIAGFEKIIKESTTYRV
jgi:hypothetical protein